MYTTALFIEKRKVIHEYDILQKMAPIYALLFWVELLQILKRMTFKFYPIKFIYMDGLAKN